MDQSIQTPSNDRANGERLKMIFEDLNKEKKRYERLQNHRELSLDEQKEYVALCTKLRIFCDKCKLFIKPRKNGPGKFLVDTYVKWCENQRSNSMMSIQPISNQNIPDQSPRDHLSPLIGAKRQAVENNGMYRSSLNVPVNDELSYLNDPSQKHGFKTPFSWLPGSTSMNTENNVIPAIRHNSVNRAMEYGSPINTPAVRSMEYHSPFVPLEGASARNTNTIPAKMNIGYPNVYNSVLNPLATGVPPRQHHFFENHPNAMGMYQNGIGINGMTPNMSIPESHFRKGAPVRNAPEQVYKEENVVKVSARRSSPVIVSAIPRNQSGARQPTDVSPVYSNTNLQPSPVHSSFGQKSYAYPHQPDNHFSNYDKSLSEYLDTFSQKEINIHQREEYKPHIGSPNVEMYINQLSREYQDILSTAKSPLQNKSINNLDVLITPKNKKLTNRRYNTADRTCGIAPTIAKKRKSRLFNINSRFSHLVDIKSNDAPRIELDVFIKSMGATGVNMEKLRVPILTMLDSVYHRIMFLAGMIAQSREKSSNIRKEDILFAAERVMKDFKRQNTRDEDAK